MQPSRAIPSLLVLLVAVAACSTPSTAPASSRSSEVPGAGETARPSAQPTSEPTDVPTAQPTAAPVTGTTYTVGRGDTLAAIARAYGTSIQQLQAWNSERYPSLAESPNVIEPGWNLTVSRDPDVTPLPV